MQLPLISLLIEALAWRMRLDNIEAISEISCRELLLSAFLKRRSFNIVDFHFDFFQHMIY